MRTPTDPFGNPCASRRHADPEMVEPDPTRACLMCGAMWTAEVGTCPQCGACCDIHSRTCEPPSELCCHGCTEIKHTFPFPHADGSTCVLDATAPTSPGEGDGTGSGPLGDHGAAEWDRLTEMNVADLPKWEADLLERNAIRDAAIEAAARALGNHVHQADLAWEAVPQTTRDFWTACAVEAVRAAEPILCQAVAEQIARRIDGLEDLDYETAAEVVRRDNAAEIAREVGRER